MPYPITHFEVHVTDIERGKKFYGELFGWTFQDWKVGDMTYCGVMTKDGEKGTNGGMLLRQGEQNPVDGAAVNAFVCTMEITEPIDDLMDKVVAAGGTIALPKRGIPGMGWLGYCKDPDGNIFGLMQEDENTK